MILSAILKLVKFLNRRETEGDFRVKDLFGDKIQSYKSRFKKVNPMVLKYGELEGLTCKTCTHLKRRCHGAGVFIKCELRGITHGAGTDHLANWEACRQYKEKY